MEKNYYISGYTGFCPDMAHRIGQNYTQSTRDALQEQPHLRGRLGAMRWHELHKDGGRLRNEDGFECAYDAMPNYASDYTGHIPTNLWTSCKREDQRYEDARCPLKAYSLSCSDYGSSCLDNRCRDEFNVCSMKGYGYDDNMFLNVPHGACHRNQYHTVNKSSKSCCSSCSKGGKCEGERRGHYSAPKQPSKACCSSCSKGGPCESDQRNVYKLSEQASKACCNSCAQGGPCESDQRSIYKCKSDQRNVYKLSKQASKACCNSCAQGGPCESDRRSHYQSAKQSSRASYRSCSSGGSHETSRRSESSRPSCCMFKFQEMEGKPYRKCGVIPNYMGYIPGMQMTYGEPYGITANRLLQRHFNEQENRHF